MSKEPFNFQELHQENLMDRMTKMLVTENMSLTSTFLSFLEFKLMSFKTSFKDFTFSKIAKTWQL